MRSTRTSLHGALIALLALGPTGGAAPVALAAGESGAAVVDWNLTAQNTIVVAAGQPPPVAILSFAIVHAAVYDAVNAIDGGHEPYLGGLEADPSDSKSAAAGTAAFRVLAGLFPSQSAALQTTYDAWIAGVPEAGKAGGIAVGEAAATAMLAARANDGRFVLDPPVLGTDPGDWRPTPTVVDPASWVRNVTPFLVPDIDRFLLDGPDPLTSDAYTRDFDEVKAIGSADSTVRTAAQTAIARFWTEHATGAWNRTMRTLAQARGLDIVDAARMFAMANLTAADSVIACWVNKWHFQFWRPSTAIELAGLDGNPNTAAQPGWTPLIANPPYPDYPSGHNCVSSGILHALQAFFGTDRVSFTAMSTVTGSTRTFDRFSHAFKEIIEARIWSGLHFRLADVHGKVLGMKVARFMEQRFFEPAG